MQQHHSLFGLAPEGVYHATIFSDQPGGLLPHLFTLTMDFCKSVAVCFLWHFPYRGIWSAAPREAFAPRDFPHCGVRTFLPGNTLSGIPERLPATAAPVNYPSYWNMKGKEYLSCPNSWSYLSKREFYRTSKSRAMPINIWNSRLLGNP